MNDLAENLALNKKRRPSKSRCFDSVSVKTPMAKKHLGQHFLMDEAILDRLAASLPSAIELDLASGKIQLVEVGIGLGDLTKRLACKYQLIAYEIDKRLIDLVSSRLNGFIDSKNLSLVEADVLAMPSLGFEGNNDAPFSPSKQAARKGYLLDREYFLVSNLPYYAATHILLEALGDGLCSGFLVMTQKEVAKKFCAKVGEKEYCSLSIKSEILGRIEYLFDVPPSSFSPAPKVDSAVFRFERSRGAAMPLAAYDREVLDSLLRQAFSAPRKKLLSNLARWDRLDKEGAREVFARLNLEENLRPHEISSKAYCDMASCIATLIYKDNA